LVLAIIGIFGFARTAFTALENSLESAAIMAGVVIVAIIAFYLYQRFKKTRKHAYVVPWSLFLLYTLACCLTHDFVYFFMMSTLVGLVAAIYLEKKQLLFYLVGANLVGLLIVATVFPLSELGSTEDIHVLLVKWLLLLFLSALVYRYAQFGEFKDEQADKAESTIKTLVEIIDVKTLIEAKDSAEKANEAKTKFLSNVSHEMRTPLNAVIGFSELSLESKGITEEVRENLQRIRTSGKTLLALINDILDLSKMEAGKYELVPVEYSVANIINDCMTTNMVRAKDKPIEFTVNVDEMIPRRLFGDEMRVKGIFNNLLSNAFKYTNEGSIEWDISFEDSSDGIWLVSQVRDTGIGLYPEVTEKIFESFNQFDLPNNRKIEGTGLGLPITKRIVELMDGTITVDSEHGKGSTFTVRIRQGNIGALPLGIVAARQLHEKCFVSEEDTDDARLERPFLPDAHVLVVDDIPNNLLVAKGMMQPYEMKVTCVTNGFDAIKLVKEERLHFDAIFMDQMMPEMDGIETVRIIREEIGTDYAKNLPIIALTANAIEGNEDMLLGCGFQAFISKPIDIHTLDKVVCTWIRDKVSADVARGVQEDAAVSADEARVAQEDAATSKDLRLSA
jgi:signal transduction histidine kinase/DNA-binding NarL/FixJ family response regulator